MKQSKRRRKRSASLTRIPKHPSFTVFGRGYADQLLDGAGVGGACKPVLVISIFPLGPFPNTAGQSTPTPAARMTAACFWKPSFRSSRPPRWGPRWRLVFARRSRGARPLAPALYPPARPWCAAAWCRWRGAAASGSRPAGSPAAARRRGFWRGEKKSSFHVQLPQELALSFQE